MAEWNENDVFDWDDEIEEEREFTTVPAGKYDFEVISVERSTYDGSEKIPPCKLAIVTFKLSDGDKTGFATERFYLCKSQERRLSSLFKACGLKETGKKARMQWDKISGSTGRCKVGTREYNGNEYNTVPAFYAKEDKDGDSSWD